MGDTPFMRRIFAAVAFLLLAQPAHAALSVCNKTAHPVRVALGFFNGTDWASRGWWSIAPRDCPKLIEAPLDARYYYLYATDGGSGSWAGGRSFCVASDEKFEIASRANCAGRGYDRKGFFAVDTGDQPDFTQYIAD